MDFSLVGSPPMELRQIVPTDTIIVTCPARGVPSEPATYRVATELSAQGQG
jgi:hypothetical protein